MNKKIIAIAIASALAAPVAMADVKVSGRVGAHFASISDEGVLNTADADDAKLHGFNAVEAGDVVGEAATTLGDQGHTRLQFDATSGKAFARLAYDARLDKDLAPREAYLGYKFGAGSVQVGRMAGALKNLEKDPYIATFLEVRGTSGAGGGAYGSNSFVDHLVQYSTKISGLAVKVQYDAGDNASVTDNEGHMAVSVMGKAGGVKWWAGMNTADDDEQNNDSGNVKVGASMKFGAVKGTVQFEDTTINASDLTRILIMADMGLGQGASVNAALGNLTSDDIGDSTWVRLAYAKKLNKGTTVYAGYTSSDFDGDISYSIIGAGMTIKF